jgi:dihydrolipoamide dehydrogenase
MKTDVIVIGAGPGGYVAAIRAAQLGLKVVCVDQRKEPGGTCLNVGCIPSKALLHSSEFYWKIMHEAPLQGIEVGNLALDFPAMMGRKREVVAQFGQGVLSLFKKNQVTYLVGKAKIISPTSVQVGGEIIEARHIILATGSEPATLPFLPIDEKRIVTSTGALSLQQVPSRLCVIGAGVIGVEIGSIYSRLGSKVEFVEFLDRICPTLDTQISKELEAILKKQGMAFRLSSKVTGAEISPREVALRTESGTIASEVVLVAIGRKPYTQGLGLENVGIQPGTQGTISVDGHFRTRVPTIYAIGDLIDGPMLAHKAEEEGICVAEIIAGQNPTLEYLAIPNVIYTYPEVATVGLTEAEAQKMGVTPKTGLFPFKANSRAPCMGENQGFVKIVADSANDRLLGVHILGPHASELIAEAALALRHHLTVTDLIHTPHAHPTLSEAIKEAAMAIHQRAIHR